MAYFPSMAKNDEASGSSPDTEDTKTLDEGAEGKQEQATDAKSVEAGKAEGAEGSQSSGEQGGKKSEDEGDLLSVVRDVVSARKKDKKSEGDEGSPPGKAEEEGSGQQKKEPDNENFSDVPFHKHPRFQQLLHTAKTSKQDAERYRNVQGFLERSGIDGEEAAQGLTIMALAKVNPTEAWKQIRPWVEKLIYAAGEALPDDLEKRVTAGEFTREAAFEIARARAGEQSLKAQREHDEKLRQHQEQQGKTQAIYDAASSWEADRQEKDPNFAAKLVPLQKEIAYLHATEGRPDTPQGVREQLDKAYKAVNDALPPVQQQRPQQRREIQPINGGAVAGSTRPEPKTTLDIVRASRASA